MLLSTIITHWFTGRLSIQFNNIHVVRQMVGIKFEVIALYYEFQPLMIHIDIYSTRYVKGKNSDSTPKHLNLIGIFLAPSSYFYICI